jgi:hypothetical protein
VPPAPHPAARSAIKVAASSAGTRSLLLIIQISQAR